MCWIGDHIDVCEIAQTALLFTNNILVRFNARVPQSTIVLTDWALFTNSCQAIVNEPTARTLKAVIKTANPWQTIFTINTRSRQETNCSHAVAGLVYSRLPESGVIFGPGFCCLCGGFDSLGERFQACAIALQICERHSIFLV